jgi:hypothetical protein
MEVSIQLIWMILCIAVVIYLICLFSRLVHAVETIARKIESPTKI